MLLTSMLGHRQEIFESKGKKLSSSTKSPADWMPADKISTALSRIKQKTWTRQPVSMITDHSAHSTPLPVGFRTWLWRYRCFLLLMSMLWHRQAIYSNRKKTSCLPLLNAVFEPRVSDTKSPADWMPADKKERLRYPGSIKKNRTRQHVSMISEHSVHTTPMPVGFRTWLWRYTHFLLLIAMLWLGQVVFESKGDKLSPSTECRIRTQCFRHQTTSRPNGCWQTDLAIEDQAKKLNSTARLYDQRAFSPLDPTASWLSHLAVVITKFVFVNFDAPAQASNIRNRREAVFICWMQDSKPGSQAPNRQQTDLTIDGQAKTKPWTRQLVLLISEHSTHSTPLPVGFRTWLWRYTCLLLISMLWHRQAIFESKGGNLSSSAECRIRTQGLRQTPNRQ